MLVKTISSKEAAQQWPVPWEGSAELAVSKDFKDKARLMSLACPISQPVIEM